MSRWGRLATFPKDYPEPKKLEPAVCPGCFNSAAESWNGKSVTVAYWARVNSGETCIVCGAEKLG